MAVRQYIGARYVPRFVGLYDVTQSYEALDVVDNGSGTSYIAKKPTPAGTPLTDTNYWFLYGSTSGAIVNLQQQINDMKDGTVPGSLQNQINDNASDITALQKHGDIIVMAASYGVTPSVSDNCMVYLQTMLDKIYDNVYTTAVSSTSFHDGSYLAMLQALEGSINNPSHVSDIVIIGVGNDAISAFSDVLTAMITFRQYCYTTYPNARVSIAPVSVEGSSAGSVARYTLYNNIVNFMTAHEICVMSPLNKILALNYPKYTGADFWHPSSDGAKLIAEGVYNCLVTGSFNKQEDYGEPASAKTFPTELGTPIGYFQDFVWNDIETTRVAFAATFTPVSNYSISTSWNVTKLMTANPLLRGDSEIWRGRCFQAVLVDLTSGKEYTMRISLAYDSGKYWYFMSGAQSITLESGKTYYIRSYGEMPFALN